MSAHINAKPTGDVSSLVHEDKVHKSIYTDPAIFDLEMDRIWGKSWIYVGHESQVSEPGQYYSTTIGSQPVLLTLSLIHI